MELLTARCIALMHTLAEYEEQAFLDQVWLQDSARALGQATARRILTQAGELMPLDRNPLPLEADQGGWVPHWTTLKLRNRCRDFTRACQH